MNDVGEWEKYWQPKRSRFWYNLVASLYRRFLIKNSFNHYIKRYFPKRARLLHAGCGGGETDIEAVGRYKISAVDFSPVALSYYQKNNPTVLRTIKADIRRLPFNSSVFDGVYNLGVMEHYSPKEIIMILRELKRVLKPNGVMLLFWPPEYGLSVLFFKGLVLLFKKVLGIKRVKFHPSEISRLKSRRQATKMCQKVGLKMVAYHFGPRDAFTYALVVATIIPTAQPKKTPVLVTKNTTYISLPSGVSTSDEWETIVGSDFYLSKNDHPGLVGVYLEGSIKLTNSNGVGYVRLYDVTHGIVPSGGELSTSSSTLTFTSTGKIYLWEGYNRYQIQLRSTSSDTMVFADGRLKIITQQ